MGKKEAAMSDFTRTIEHGVRKVAPGEEIGLELDYSSIWGGRCIGEAVTIDEIGAVSHDVLVRETGGGMWTTGPTGRTARLLLSGPVTLRVTYSMHECDAARYHHYGTEVHEWKLEPSAERIAADRLLLDKLEQARLRAIDQLVIKYGLEVVGQTYRLEGKEVWSGGRIVIGRRPLSRDEAESRLETVRAKTIRRMLRDGYAWWEPPTEGPEEIPAGARWIRYHGPLAGDRLDDVVEELGPIDWAVPKA
jgi:hypothetical protein